MAWPDIGEVTLEGARLNLAAKSGAGLVLVNPRSPADPTFRGPAAGNPATLGHQSRLRRPALLSRSRLRTSAG